MRFQRNGPGLSGESGRLNVKESWHLGDPAKSLYPSLSCRLEETRGLTKPTKEAAESHRLGVDMQTYSSKSSSEAHI